MIYMSTTRYMWTVKWDFLCDEDQQQQMWGYFFIIKKCSFTSKLKSKI